MVDCVAIPTTLEMDTFLVGPSSDQYMESDQPMTGLPSMETFIHHDDRLTSQTVDLSMATTKGLDPSSYDSCMSSIESAGEEDKPTYYDLKPPQKLEKNLFDGIDEDPMDSWVYKHPEEWQGREILDWIYSWLPKIDSNVDKDCQGENFSELTGRELTKMSEQEFCKLEPNYGSTLYKMLHRLLKESQFIPMPEQDYEMSPEEIKRIFEGETIAAFEDCQKDPTFVTYDYDPNGLRDFSFVKSEGPYDDGYESTSSSEFPHVPTTVFQCDTQDTQGGGLLDATLPYHLPGNRGDATHPHHHLPHGGGNPWQQQQYGKNKQGPGRPRARVPSDCSSDGEVPPPAKKRGRRLGQVSNKGNHLWEFIRDLLLDPSTNPSLIRWEDEENGVFRIVNSKKVSELWGKKKNNPVMNYEKLSRAMRFCRGEQYFDNVPRDKGFPKKLCFRFGPKSFGWKN